MHKPRHAPKSNPRRVAANVVAKIMQQDVFSNVALSNAIDSSDLAPIDKSLCTELVYGTIRWAKALDISIRRALDRPDQKLDEKMMPHLLVAAYQLQYLSDKIPAHSAVNEAVNEIKRIRPYLGGFANAILRRLGSPMHLTIKADCSDLSVLSEAFGLPLFLVEAFASSLPAPELYHACAAMNDRPKLWLRVFDEKAQPAGETHPFVPQAIGLNKMGNIKDLEGFQSGNVTIQDPASQVAGLLVDAPTSAFVIDFCAAPGSKSIILKKAVGLNGRVLAVDINEAKIQRIKENARRIKVDVEVLKSDARELSVSFQNAADAILLDAPCSGLGTLRRHPEIKLRRERGDIDELIALQSELLDSASRCLKPGGVLVYSVCSPMPEEGTLQIEKFLQRHANFKRQHARDCLPWLPLNATNDKGEVLLWPHRHDCDAFFAVRLVKEYN